MTDRSGTPDRDLLDEGMDLRLEEYGARWREELPTPPVSTAAVPVSRRRRWLVPSAAAAAVAVVLGVTVAVTAGDRDRQPPDSADSTDTTPGGAVVPWKPLPATNPDLPVTTTGPSAAEIAAAPACSAGDLAVADWNVGAAAGTLYMTVSIGLTDAAEECRVEGYPEVRLLGPDSEPLPVAVEHADTRRGSKPTLITRRSGAEVVIAWSPSHDCRNLDNTQIAIDLPSGGGEVVADGFGHTTCNPGETGGPAFVQPVRPAEASRTSSPYRRLSVTGNLRVISQQSATVGFEVTLTSPVDLPLDPCPDFRMGDIFDVDLYGLNCDAVPYTDADGRPYLPAGVPVTFAMEVRYGAGASKVNWELIAPGRPTWIGDLSAESGVGTVTGKVTMDGGPPPGTSIPVTSGEITFTSPDGATGSGASIDSDGRYRVELPPGEYDVEVSTPQWNHGSPYSGGKFSLTGGTTNQLDISLPMK